MSSDTVLLTVLSASCLLLCIAQIAEQSRPVRLLWLVVMVAALCWSGDWASRTSISNVAAWAADPARRADLAALLVAEALFFNGQALAAALGQPGQSAHSWRRRVNSAWPPSALLVLFFGQVMTLLSIDEVDYDVLTLIYATFIPVLLLLAAKGLCWALPAIFMRCGLRLALHALQIGAALWLSRPLLSSQPQPVPIPLLPLSVLLAVAVVCMALGWGVQRWGARRQC